MAQNAQTAPPIDPVALPGSGGGGSDIVIVTIDGKPYAYDKAKGTTTPITAPDAPIGPPAPKGGNKHVQQGDDGAWYLIDEDTHSAVPINGMPPGTPKATAPKGPKTTVSGASTSDQFIAQTDPTTGEVTWAPNKNYVAPSTDTAALTNANTARERLAWEQAQAQAKDYQSQLQQQIDAGALSNQQAISLFDKQLAALNFGELAGQDAVAYAKDETANQVGPQFGAHFADALSGRGVNFSGADFQYKTPNYRAIATAATARAIAHLSPFAAQIAATMGTPSTDAGSSGAVYPGPGAGAGAGIAVPAQAPAPVAAGVMIPNYTGPPGPANGWLPDAPGGQLTIPHPPFVGLGPYRPGG